MNNYSISEQVITKMQQALSNNKNWLAYNMESNVLQQAETHFTKSKGEAINFVSQNNSSEATYRIIHFNTVEEAINNLKNKNLSIMNEKNLDKLKESLTNLGFGDTLHAKLEENIVAQRPEFSLQHQIVYNNQKMEVDLSFKQGKENEMYFFNRYTAKLTEPSERSQAFFLDRGNGITTKEAFNLLEGRAVNKDLVNKDGEKYNAWVQLNFEEKETNGNYKLNRYHEKYNYDIAKEVSNLVLKPMPEEQEKRLMDSLYKGNLQSASFLRNGEEVKMFIEANPKDRTINIYNSNMQPLSKEEKLNFIDMPPKEKKEQQSQKAGPAGSDDGEDGPELKKKRTRKNGIHI